jgi:hypothetical protein
VTQVQVAPCQWESFSHAATPADWMDLIDPAGGVGGEREENNS